MKCFGLSDILLQCDPEPDTSSGQKVRNPNAKNKHSSEVVPDHLSHQSNGAEENYEKQVQEKVRVMLAALQDRTKILTDHWQCTDEMDWSTRSLADSSFQGQRWTVPFCRDMGGPCRANWLEFGESVLAHLLEVGKGSAVWLGQSDLTDEHLVRTDEGVVFARSARRIAEHSWSAENLRAVVVSTQKPKSTTLDQQ